MSFIEEKVILEEVINKIETNLISSSTPEEIKRRIANLKIDIKNDFFTIVVLGEFKRGKSTFINALLGNKILPSDVTPTTATINAIMYNEKKKTEVLKLDGTKDKGESSLEFLNNYIASVDFDVSEINYLKVGYDAEILKNNIVIVDTPGVSDINQQRVQVTYDFIPRADAVIFLLDATSPLKRTEKEFIDEYLIKIGIDRILFIANRFDNIDEDEEEEVLDDLNKRLKKSFRIDDKDVVKNSKVIPMSASLALEGHKNVGLEVVKSEIDNIIKDGSKGEEKIIRYKVRIKNILNSLNTELKNQKILQSDSVEGLNNSLIKIEHMLLEEEARKEKIQKYVEEQRVYILDMVRKSINYMYMNLAEEINERIESYKGTDFKEYIENSIAKLIKKNLISWVNTYAPNIDKLILELQKEVSKSLSKYFNVRMSNYDKSISSSISNGENIVATNIAIEAQDISNITTQAGLIAAGAAGLVTLIGGPIILPFISMAAFPMLQKNMLNTKLREAKDEIKPKLNEALFNSIEDLTNEINKSIIERIDEVEIKLDEKFVELFNKTKYKVESEMDSRRKQQNILSDKISTIDYKLDQIRNLLKKVSV